MAGPPLAWNRRGPPPEGTGPGPACPDRAVTRTTPAAGPWRQRNPRHRPAYGDRSSPIEPFTSGPRRPTLSSLNLNREKRMSLGGLGAWGAQGNSAWLRLLAASAGAMALVWRPWWCSGSTGKLQRAAPHQAASALPRASGGALPAFLPAPARQSAPVFVPDQSQVPAR